MTVTRRDFLAAGGAAGAGLAVWFYLRHGNESHNSGQAFAPNAYLHIASDGRITVVVPRSEMGQGVRTALPMILAEELEADWSEIAIQQAGASTLFGDQTTGGSASVRTTWDPMRRAGAAAREMLIAAAAKEWGVPASECKAEKSKVIHTASTRSLSYGELADRAAKLPVPSDPPLKSEKDYKLVGNALPRVDTPSKVNGSAEFGVDFRLPGMKYAFLSRSPVIGGKVASFEDSESKKVPGFVQSMKVGDSTVAVVANTVWGAMEARRQLKVTWDEGSNKDLNSAALSEALRKAASSKAVTLYEAGDVAKVNGRRIMAEYTLPFLAHAPMEPGNTTAQFRDGKCELWSPTQVPQDCRDSVAAAVSLKPEDVKVNVTLLGGGFGRRLEHDYAVEAALVAKAANAPVKVMWTREDDMRFSTYRPNSFHQLSAVLDAQGWPVSFSHRIVSPSISRQKGQPGDGGVDPDLKDEAGFVYSIPNVRIEYVDPDSPVPLGWLRSVYASPVAFASESFLDEIAIATHRDPLELRLHLLSQDQDVKYFDTTWQTARMRGVLELVAEKANWSKTVSAGMHRGIAAFACFNTYVAEVVEIAMEGNEPKVKRVVVAADVGQRINPNILEQQAQSAVMFGLSAALRGKITFDKGRVVQSNFGDYEPVRMSEAPVVEAYFVDSNASPSGIGEPPVPPLAPALCSAIYSATKKRIRALPVVG
jgi:isoquinoline 1-oxidoreductase beta subunit